MPRIHFDRARHGSLATLFSGPSIRGLSSRAGSSRLRRVACDSVTNHVDWANVSIAEFFAAAYHDLEAHHRGEYVFANVVARRLLFAGHAARATRLFSEFRVGPCWVDLLMVNGTTTAYEIKSARDRLDRLPAQLEAYRRVFDKTVVVCNPERVREVEQIAPTDVGIVMLTRNLQLRCVRESASRRACVEPPALFGLLREAEASRILDRLCGGVPNVPNTLRHEVWREQFCTLNPAEAHDAVADALRARQLPKEVEDLVIGGPAALTAGLIGADLRGHEASNIARRLAAPVSSRPRA
jgi:hypothetical protein